VEYRADILNLKRPPVYSDEWTRREQLEGLSRMSNSYFESLRTRLRQGDYLTTDEMERLKMYLHIKDINDALDNLPNTPEHDHNLPDSDGPK
jgi:hypothetical protein